LRALPYIGKALFEFYVCPTTLTWQTVVKLEILSLFHSTYWYNEGGLQIITVVRTKDKPQFEKNGPQSIDLDQSMG